MLQHPPKPPEGTMRSRRLGRTKTRGYRDNRGTTHRNTIQAADIFTTAAFPGRSEALDVCAASSNAATARGDAAQAGFDRKTSHYRTEIPEL